VNRLQSALTHLGADLTALDLRWALVGGWAVTIRAQPRLTDDLDVVIAVSGDREAERVAFALLNRGYLYPPEHALEQKEEIVAAADLMEIQGLRLPVAQTGHLVALKVLAGREKDAEDARWLWEAADMTERQRARDSLALITRRRFNRGKDLVAELARILPPGR